MCWWLDRNAVKQTLMLRDQFAIKEYVETGTFRGINLRFWAHHFQSAQGIELEPEYFEQTRRRIQGDRKIVDQTHTRVFQGESPEYLHRYMCEYVANQRRDIVLFYLDAHFYRANVPAERRWVVKEELQSLENFRQAVIVIHDMNFDGLNGLVYDGESLTFETVKDELLRVNPTFFFYRNDRIRCDPRTQIIDLHEQGLFSEDEGTVETMEYHANDRLRYRGLLYAIPAPVELSEGLIRL